MSASPHDGDDTAARIGERLASLRADRGLRVTELARRAGVSPSLVSQIERGQSRPSVATLVALADSVGAPIDALFREREEPAAPAAADDARAPAARIAAPGRTSGGYLVRRDERESIEIEGGVRWERLTPGNLEGGDIIELVYAPGSQSHARAYRHPEGTEMVLVLAGTLVVEVDGVAHALHAGDSLTFPSSAEHRYFNPTSEEARGVGARVYRRSA
jgi:transcriptional regulator with XRE-family HTH domain